jgi:hypothetical protein
VVFFLFEFVLYSPRTLFGAGNQCKRGLFRFKAFRRDVPVGFGRFNGKSIFCHFAKILTLAELEPAPGSASPEFFPLHHARIAGKEPVVPQRNGIAFVHLAERPGQAVPAGAGLSV